MTFKRSFEFIASIAAIGEDMAQPGKAIADGFEDIDRTVAVLNVAVLNIGGVDQDEYQKTAGVGDDMPLAALHLLACIIARNPACFP